MFWRRKARDGICRDLYLVYLWFYINTYGRKRRLLERICLCLFLNWTPDDQSPLKFQIRRLFVILQWKLEDTVSELKKN